MPQRVAQIAILMFFLPIKLNFCVKKSATKFLSVKSFRGKVVATSFLYLTVHGWIAGDVPIFVIFALKVTHPFKKLRQILPNSASIVKRSSIITNRKPTMRFPSSHR